MHRLTTRFLLVVLLVSLFAPALLALSASSPPDCCRRDHCRMHDHGAASEQTATFGSFYTCPGNCRHFLVVPNWVAVHPSGLASPALPLTSLRSLRNLAFQPAAPFRSSSVRGPPFSTVA